MRLYDYPGPDHTVDARGVDWVGQAVDGVDLEGNGDGCFVGGRIEGTWNPADSWDLYHGRKALPAGLGSYKLTLEKVRLKNFGDGAVLELATPCPNGSPIWLLLRDSLLEDLHDDAVESDGLCSVEVEDTLIDRAYVAFGFRNRESQPNRNGSANTVYVRNNLIRMHAFANNYQGQTVHNGIWKWARAGRGPKLVSRNNRFLAFDAPGGGTLFPFVNRVHGLREQRAALRRLRGGVAAGARRRLRRQGRRLPLRRRAHAGALRLLHRDHQARHAERSRLPRHALGPLRHELEGRPLRRRG